MKKLIFLFLLVLMGLIGIFAFKVATKQPKNKQSVEQTANGRLKVSHDGYRTLRLELSYTQSHPDLIIENLQMIGEVGPHGVEGWPGRILRGLRFRNASQAVEDRYNLPQNSILAMLIHETNGVDLLPNGSGDGGFGICHMQGSIASRFGLKTYGQCNTLVCNGKNNGLRGSCKRSGVFVNHADELLQIIKKEKFNRSRLIKYDDRLHPILCLDAVGRMIAEGMDKPPTNDYLKSIGPLRRALYRYSGRKEYFEKVSEIMRMLEDKSFFTKIRADFNQKNLNLKINGQPSGFDEYIEFMNQDLENYGLSEYRKLPKYEPKNSQAVLNTYRDVMFKRRLTFFGKQNKRPQLRWGLSFYTTSSFSL